MAWTNTILAVAAVASISLQGVELVDIVLRDTLPEPIEGRGATNDVGRPGENVVVDWIITKRTSCSGMSGRVWSTADGFYLQEPLTITTLPVTLDPKPYHIPTKIPYEVDADFVTLNIVGWYECPNAKREHFTLGPVVIELERDSASYY